VWGWWILYRMFDGKFSGLRAVNVLYSLQCLIIRYSLSNLKYEISKEIWKKYFLQSLVRLWHYSLLPIRRGRMIRSTWTGQGVLKKKKSAMRPDVYSNAHSHRIEDMQWSE
jgi:hypothetical protein